ncbi:hypothetical protein A3J56_01800 [Candidatus Giovannonibacteria bacterium RIFCSPHIGHO2_02_FULL_46_20]|uniref:NAD-dependent epimerase/dehydratase domain-containing protein n=1 Tax=Candidatus Giovannonibacteria bacterium RIFCSPHIGHO2_02_FULL_46_20 TaxID=1798338 RepID=A0A1F5WEN6_9BACT|nr:MAG: hypothetical protein A3J56_01800 [Candidatus Giovannonibacteria bacterium RIFCSPHIGHO2_02_FULL_46_20]
MINVHKRALVTGGCGFVGRHLVRDLLADGAEVWILDNLFTGKHPDTWLLGYQKHKGNDALVYKKNNGKVVFYNEDTIDFFRKQIGNDPRAIPHFNEVYHLAAIVGGRAVLIEENPILVATNKVIDALFFQWVVANKERIGRVLYVSTCVAYPKAMQARGKHMAMKEEYLSFVDSGFVGLPESIYGWIKLTGEYLAKTTADKYGVSVVCARPFSGYGEEQDLDYPIPSIAARAACRENPLTVWGSGDQGRDFIYIDDFVSALRLAIQKVSDGSAVNIGTGKLTTFKEVARIMAELEGYNPEIIGLSDKAEGSFAAYSDSTYLVGLGWTPTHTIHAGFKKVFEYVKKNL